MENETIPFKRLRNTLRTGLACIILKCWNHSVIVESDKNHSGWKGWCYVRYFQITVKFRKLSPGLIFFKGLFWGVYFWRGLSMEGNLRFKIDWAGLVVGSKFTIFAKGFQCKLKLNTQAFTAEYRKSLWPHLLASLAFRSCIQVSQSNYY